MTYEEKYNKLVGLIDEKYDRLWDECPNYDTIQSWTQDETMSKETMKARNLGMYMATEDIWDYVHRILEGGE